MTATMNPSDLDPTGMMGEHLTARETDIIKLVTNGLSNHEIAAELYLSINSVKTYIRTAYRKIGATSRSQAVIWGVRHGFLDGVPLSFDRAS